MPPNGRLGHVCDAPNLSQGVNASGSASTEGLPGPSILDRTIPFTRSQLSIALSILKTKPAALSIKDYCIQLRKSIKIGKPSKQGETRYIDTVEFWKGQYTLLHRERLSLEVENSRLTKLDSSLDGSRRTKIGAGGVVRAGNRKCGSVPPRHAAERAGMPHERFFIEDLEPTTPNYLPLFKHAQVLHQLLQDDKISSETLLSTLRSCLSYMMAVLQHCTLGYNHGYVDTGDPQGRNVQPTLDTLAALFNLSLRGLRHLSRDITGRRCKLQVVYLLVQFFRSILDHIHTACSVAAEKDWIVRSAQMRTRSHTKHEHKTRIPAILPQLTKLLVNVITSEELLKGQTAFSEVTEGLVSILLQRIGGLVSEAIFRERVSDSNLPGNITTDKEHGKSEEREYAVQLEGKHLAWALERVIALAKERNNQPLIDILSVKDLHSQKEQRANSTLSAARKRLQQTLLVGLFGEDGDKFVGALKIPEDHDGDHIEVIEVGAKPESFIESIWSIIGWQMLREA